MNILYFNRLNITYHFTMFELNKECKGENGEGKKSVYRHAHEKESRCKILKQT